MKVPLIDLTDLVELVKAFRPLIFLGQSEYVDCAIREGEKDDYRSESIFQGAA